MLVAMIGRDKAGATKIRRESRPDHLAYIEETGIVFMAGPLLDLNDKMIGSLVILDVETMDDAQAWVENDPYAKAGLFQSVDLVQWKKVVG